MWLINVDSLERKHFKIVTVPYAILSHRWLSDEEEVTFERYDALRNMSLGTLGMRNAATGDTSRKRKRRASWDGAMPQVEDTLVQAQAELRLRRAGFDKIKKFCKKVRDVFPNISWAWADTCCIDKRSSAETTEAINSMWRYYKEAAVCFVYLRDADESNWLQSKWWTRGWTLQELLAPTNVVFFDARWDKLGTRHDHAEIIAEERNIPIERLREEPMWWSVAQKMSWAAGRETTELEDRAYSLLGLFEINMPIMYGEGLNAFRRLQLAILDQVPDESVFAWYGQAPHFLAPSPDAFEGCGNIGVAYNRTRDNLRSEGPPRRTSWGVQINATARKLIPKPERNSAREGMLWSEKFLWAVTLTASVAGSIQELPCTVVLSRGGPSPYSYIRARALHTTYDGAERHLRKDFKILPAESNKLFFLHFDERYDETYDFDSSEDSQDSGL